MFTKEQQIKAMEEYISVLREEWTKAIESGQRWGLTQSLPNGLTTYRFDFRTFTPTEVIGDS